MPCLYARNKKKILADKTEKSEKFSTHIYKTNKNSPIFGGLI
jgi:hypothetical protein